MSPLERVEVALEKAGSRRDGRNWTCPAHDDREASLSVSEGGDGKVLLYCHAGCHWKAVLKALALNPQDLFPEESGKSRSTPSRNRATVQPPGTGCTLAAYSQAKRLPEGFLRQLGLEDYRYRGAPAIRIRYYDASGAEAAIRYRMRLEKGREREPRFHWKTGSKTLPYGLWRLPLAHEAGWIVLVEGESDAHTLWHHGIPALGLPGADTWREEWASFLDGLAAIYAVVEPDGGGEIMRAKLVHSPLVDRLHLIELRAAKDPSELHGRDPQVFAELFETARREAVPARDAAEAEKARRSSEAWVECETLARMPRILDVLVKDLAARGVVGEERLCKLVYLATTSRLLDRPVSIVVKGPSSAGKSYTVEETLRLFPSSAYYPLTSMSEHALAYSEEPLAHRHLVLYEAAGIEGDFASYLLRSLLSEGRIRYETVEKTSEGMRARLIERPGPTGVILTTTRVRLHPENETRMLSVPVDDTQEQTSRILYALTEEATAAEVEKDTWHALQAWLAVAGHRVRVPFLRDLARLIPPVAVRLRRDFPLLRELIRAHALLHQATRERDDEGWVVADLDDYVVVHELVVDLVAQAVQAAVAPTIRDTVRAVSEILDQGVESATVVQVAERLGLDKSAASRRVAAAKAEGYIRNLEEKRGRPARLELGDPLPEERPLLPAPEALAERLHGCSGAEGDEEPTTAGEDREEQTVQRGEGG